MQTVGNKQVAHGLDEGFVGWVEGLAAELYAAGHRLYGVEEPESYAACRDFLLSGHALGGRKVFTTIWPGFYINRTNHGDTRSPGENLLYWIWEAAWRELDEEDCVLRVCVLFPPHGERGEVIGLDLTKRKGLPNGFANGTVLFHEQPHLEDLICSKESDLLNLYRWAASIEGSEEGNEPA